LCIFPFHWAVFRATASSFETLLQLPITRTSAAPPPHLRRTSTATPTTAAFKPKDVFLDGGEHSILRRTATEDRQFAATPQWRQKGTVR